MNHEEGVGGSDSAPPVREAQPVVSQAAALDETSSSACGCIPSGVFRPVTSMRGGNNTNHPQHNVGDQSTQARQGSGQAEAQIRAYSLMIVEISITGRFITIAVANNTTSGSGSESEEPRMIGDFDGSANEFWKLYRDEAKSNDEATISTLKDGMDSALIFVRSYSDHVPIIDLVMLIRGLTGWFIFCCSHSIRGR